MQQVFNNNAVSVSVLLVFPTHLLFTGECAGTLLIFVMVIGSLATASFTISNIQKVTYTCLYFREEVRVVRLSRVPSVFTNCGILKRLSTVPSDLTGIFKSVVRLVLAPTV